MFSFLYHPETFQASYLGGIHRTKSEAYGQEIKKPDHYRYGRFNDLYHYSCNICLIAGVTIAKKKDMGCKKGYCSS